MGKPAARLMDPTAHGGMITGPGCPTVLIGKMPAARMSDMHMCPMVTPAVPPIPHVGGPIMAMGAPTVLIGKLPAATLGDMAICVGPPSTIIMGAPTVLLGPSGAGGGGGGGGKTADAKAAKTLSGKAPSKVEGLETAPMDIQQTMAEAAEYMTPEEVKLKVGEIQSALARGANREKEEEKKFTLKDIVGILKAIESEESYETARFFASHLDYRKMTEMAMTKDQEPDNDPNQMPTRFMLLFGMDDGSLQSQDDHPDKFENEDHKINIVNLRKGLKLLGYEVADSGPFDEEVLTALYRYIATVKMGGPSDVETHVVADDEDLGTIASKYGIFSWKYLHELNKDAVGDNPDLLKPGTQLTIPKWDSTSGDEKFEEKGVKPYVYVNGLRYCYPWVPFSVTMVGKEGSVYTEKNSSNEQSSSFDNEKEYKVVDSKSKVVLVTGKISNSEEIETLVPDAAGKTLFIGEEEFIFKR